jgi:multimeric flavodoxin WrbA
MDAQERRILIVYASQSGGTTRMAEAVERGALADAGSGGAHEANRVVVRRIHGTDASLEDLLWCDALVIATPENFGYMAGAVKDFFDRTYYPAEGLVTKLPYALVVKAGHDGSFAIQAVQRIARGYGFEPVADPILSVGELTPEQLAQCEELGQLLSAGLELGVFGRTRRAAGQSTK